MLEAGRILGRRYEVIEEIGSGGMAIVYKGIDHKLNRPVAIKVLKQEFSLDETILGKFRKEALAAGSLSHPNIVGVYDLGHEIGCDYIVMEYIDGITLKEYIQRRDHLSSEEVLKISIKIAEALKTAHEHGIIHRDIKPQNIMVTPSGEVKVTDFGIAKAMSSNTVTSTGETLGSVHYISPEQARGDEVDARSDLYSLGITMYEMATKRLPFTAETPVAVAVKQIHDPMPDPMTLAPQIWPGLSDIILKLTQKKPDLRYQSADELIRDMKHLYRNHSYRLMNNSPEGTDYGRSAQEVQHENQRRRTQMAREREERMKKARRRRIAVISISAAVVILVIMLAFLLRSILRGDSGSAGSSSISASSEVLSESSQEVSSSETESSEESSEQIVLVPNFLGKTYEEARELADQYSIYLTIETQYSDDTESGIILSQSPVAGQQLGSDNTVTIIISLGPENSVCTVPDLYNVTQEQAQQLLEEEGLVLGEVSTEYSSEIEEGNVIEQGIAEGTQVARGTKVDITISLGAEEESSVSQNGTISISQPFTKADESGELTVYAYDSSGTQSEIYQNKVSYATFSSLGGVIKVAYPAGTVKVEVYLDGKLILTEQVN